jgi:hypothetical protein
MDLFFGLSQCFDEAILFPFCADSSIDGVSICWVIAPEARLFSHLGHLPNNMSLFLGIPITSCDISGALIY